MERFAILLAENIAQILEAGFVENSIVIDGFGFTESGYASKIGSITSYRDFRQ